MKISVITATYNSSNTISDLINSLVEQTDNDFQWIVADGDSADSTLKIIKSSGLNSLITSIHDFGVYDALNRAIKISKSDYYIVLGADDKLHKDAIRNFRAAAHKTNADFITASIMINGSVIVQRKMIYATAKMSSFISSHAVGTLIKRQLHDEFGYYSNRFPIAADHYFVKKCALGGATFHREDFVAGEYGVCGLSGTDVLGTLCENYRIAYETEKYKLLQTGIFILRLIKYIISR